VILPSSKKWVEKHISLHHGLEGLPGSLRCVTLQSYKYSFPESPTRPGKVDLCRFCGQEFPRSGPSSGNELRTSQGDWEERTVHLLDHHMSRQCKPIKKFDRTRRIRWSLGNEYSGTFETRSALEMAIHRRLSSTVTALERQPSKLREILT
jgi:hypothetical protein